MSPQAEAIAARAAFVGAVVGITYCAERWPRATILAGIAAWIVVGPPAVKSPAPAG